MGLLVFASDAAMASRADRRERKQQGRIGHGIKSGELTKGETRAIENRQRHIHRAEQKAERDGVVTPAEKLRLEKMQDRASRQIYRKKHNARDQNSPRPGGGSGDQAAAPADPGAQPATPAVPADPGAPGDGATPAVPAEPAQPPTD
jgi:hypothetical protein